MSVKDLALNVITSIISYLLTQSASPINGAAVKNESAFLQEHPSARIIAVSRAVPAWIDIRGKRVRTSIVRERSATPLVLDARGASGNETAVHTEHLLAFPVEHYADWAVRFGVTDGSWPLTHWGENLVVQGLTEEELPIGTVLHVGASAVLQVTSPRNPCFKLSWRLDQPDSVLPEILASGKTGFYLRVIEPGLVFDGDLIKATPPPGAGASVADVARLMADPERATTDAIQRVLMLEGLGTQCAGMLRQALTDNLDRGRTRAHRWPGWRKFIVTDVAHAGADIRSFSLGAVDGAPVAPYRAGQHVKVRVSDEAGQQHVRAWSLSDYDEKPEGYRISIKKSRRRAASAWMHERAGIGSFVELKAPSGGFCLDRSSNHPTILISAGIGVTPLLAMLKAYAALGPEAPPVHWIHVTRDGRSYAHRSEVQTLLATCPTMLSHVRYTAPKAEDRLGIDYDAVGRLTEAALRQQTAVYRYEIFGREVELPGAAAEFYVCGPAGFEEDVRRMLSAVGVAPGNIRSESFGGVGVSGAPANVRFARSAIEAEWTPGSSLLELAEAAGIAADHECRAGTCHRCATTILAGAVAYDIEPAVMPADGTVLICRSRPGSELLVLDL